MLPDAASSALTLRPEDLERLAAFMRENRDFRIPVPNAPHQAEQINVSSSLQSRDDEDSVQWEHRSLEAEVVRLRKKSSRDEATIRRLREARNALKNENKALAKRLAVSHLVVQ